MKLHILKISIHILKFAMCFIPKITWGLFIKCLYSNLPLPQCTVNCKPSGGCVQKASQVFSQEAEVAVNKIKNQQDFLL